MPRRSIFDEDQDQSEINLSPMIDCIFILLIFFIVTTVFVEEQGLPVFKPDAAASAASEETENVILEISADNQILFRDRRISLSEVTRRVESGIQGPETPVMIRAHESSSHGLFIAVWDAAKRGGAETLTFTTVN